MYNRAHTNNEENEKMTESLEMLKSIVSDTYKDAYGMRPRSESYWARLVTVEDCYAELDSLQVAVDAEIALEKARVEESIARFENVTVRNYIEAGAQDRETAVRWFLEAHGDEWVEYLCYEMNLPSDYFSAVA